MSAYDNRPHRQPEEKQRPAMLWNAVTIVHTSTAVGVLGLGSAILALRKGTPQHRLLGRLWTGSMMATCVSSFGIRTHDGRFSWIHGLSAFTVASVATGVLAIRRRNVTLHAACMRGSYAGALGAGLFAVATPGRRLYVELFGDQV